jgi:hypothetical protein
MLSSAMSLIEAVTNVIVGYVAAVAKQMTIFPWLGLNATLDQNMSMRLIFTVVSFARSRR